MITHLRFRTSRLTLTQMFVWILVFLEAKRCFSHPRCFRIYSRIEAQSWKPHWRNRNCTKLEQWSIIVSHGEQPNPNCFPTDYTPFSPHYFLMYVLACIDWVVILLWQVSVETLEKGFLISVVSERGCRTATLCSVLQVFEELGLNVVEARVSCVERFQLQVIGEVKFTYLTLNHDICHNLTMQIQKCHLA